MKEQVLLLFLEKKLKVQEISKELKISKEEILKILEQEHYLVSSNRSFDTVVSEKAVRFLNYIYKDSTIYLDRKFEKYLEICRL